MAAVRGSLQFLLVLCLLAVSATAQDGKSSFIVYLGSHPLAMADSFDPADILRSHKNMLSGIGAESVDDALLYSYKNSFNGFAAKLSDHQVQQLSALPEVVSIFPNKPNQLHTTRTWKFLGVESQLSAVRGELWDLADYGSDLIVGMIDTGVWPESHSFDDTGYSPIPGRWRGVCEQGDQFGPENCNRKLIGARHYIKGYEAALGPINLTATPEFLSPRDYAGHGTHTTSTVVGSFVPNASIFGYSEGIAHGGVPRARVSMYKVCWPIVAAPGSTDDDTCYDADMLAAFDDAIADGVDLISISIGGGVPLPPLFNDSIALGSFHAFARGIPVVASAGNSGPSPGSVSNTAPWIFTIAASTLDRNFPSSAVLGNGAVYSGVSLSPDTLPEGQYPLVLSSQVALAGADYLSSLQCYPGTLDPAKVQGKIVACLRGGNARLEKGQVVKTAGGVAMILGNAPENGDELLSDPHFLPATHIVADAAQAVFNYINSTSSPTAYVTPPSTVLGFQPAPVMASFSSQGPNTLLPDILKPDVTAPGSNILAAWTNASGLSPQDPRRFPFNVISGTSMSCPHTAGIVGLLKSIYPRWSPAALKSAIMTTAYHIDNQENNIRNGTLQPAGPYNYGSGHVQPTAAVNPGLVYDNTVEEYYKFLCGLNYNNTQVSVIAGTNVTCPTPSLFLPRDLNYPSVSVSNLTGTVTVVRTVTNVARKHGTYQVFIQPPPGVSVTIVPSELVFSKKYQSIPFTVTLTAIDPVNGTSVFGVFTWISRGYQVRSPIVVTFA